MGAVFSWIWSAKKPEALEAPEAVVYIWNKNAKSWGHVAVQADDIYISSWPTESRLLNFLKKKKQRLPINYQDEVLHFTGRECDRVYRIPSDIRKIKEWWRKQIKTQYNMFLYNCCHVAVEALNAGGASIPEKVIRRPAEMVSICEERSKTRRIKSNL